MAQIIRMQGYKDWKNGLITTEEMLAGNVYCEPPHLRKTWRQIVARARNDWDNVPHHHLCCCDKCAPTEEDRKMKIAQHKAETSHDMQEFMTHDMACCCNTCLDDMERGLYEMEEMLEHENLAPSDCEE